VKFIGRRPRTATNGTFEENGTVNFNCKMPAMKRRQKHNAVALLTTKQSDLSKFKGSKSKCLQKPKEAPLTEPPNGLEEIISLIPTSLKNFSSPSSPLPLTLRFS
jgi:hypothetical protein